MTTGSNANCSMLLHCIVNAMNDMTNQNNALHLMFALIAMHRQRRRRHDQMQSEQCFAFGDRIDCNASGNDDDDMTKWNQNIALHLAIALIELHWRRR